MSEIKYHTDKNKVCWANLSSALMLCEPTNKERRYRVYEAIVSDSDWDDRLIFNDTWLPFGELMSDMDYRHLWVPWKSLPELAEYVGDAMRCGKPNVGWRIKKIYEEYKEDSSLSSEEDSIIDISSSEAEPMRLSCLEDNISFSSSEEEVLSKKRKRTIEKNFGQQKKFKGFYFASSEEESEEDNEIPFDLPALTQLLAVSHEVGALKLKNLVSTRLVGMLTKGKPRRVTISQRLSRKGYDVSQVPRKLLMNIGTTAKSLYVKQYGKAPSVQTFYLNGKQETRNVYEPSRCSRTLDMAIKRYCGQNFRPNKA